MYKNIILNGPTQNLQATYDKMMKEIPKSKMITPSIVSERCKINGSLARQAIRHLEGEGLIQAVGETHHTLLLYTRKAAIAE